MHSFSNPIHQLRACFNPNHEVCLKVYQQNKYLYFSDGIKLPLNTPTSWFSSTTSKNYDLGSLWLFLQYKRKGETHNQYFGNISKFQMEYVNIADQNQILDYFTGKIQTTSCINQSLLEAQKNMKFQESSIKKEHEEKDEKKNYKEKSLKLEQSELLQLQVMKYCSQHEFPLKTKTKCLRHPKLKFNKIIEDINDQEKNRSCDKEKGGKSRISKFYDSKRRPIIIVPETVQSGNISIHNIEKFLLQRQYDDKIRYQNPHIARVEFRHQIRNKQILFQVVNNGSLLKKEDLDYVVAIFLSGNLSQFDNWKFSIQELMKKAKAYFIKYSGSLGRCNEMLNAKHFCLDRTVRYEDGRIAHLIWQDIENYLYEKC